MSEQFCLLDVEKIALSNSRSAYEAARMIRARLHDFQERNTTLASVSACSRAIVKNSQGPESRITTWPCRSPHACAHCTPIRQAKEREKINAWLSERSQHRQQTARIDLTVGFNPGTGLDLRYKKLLRVWSLLTQSTLFRNMKRDLDLQFVRVLEESYSASGWRPHIHALITLTENESGDSIPKLVEKWVQLARGEGLQCFAHHQSFDEIDGKGHMAVSKYLTKHGLVNLRIDFSEWSLDECHLRPFELLQALVAQGTHELFEAWVEFEKASFRKRRVSWSKEARLSLGV